MQRSLPVEQKHFDAGTDEIWQSHDRCRGNLPFHCCHCPDGRMKGPVILGCSQIAHPTLNPWKNDNWISLAGQIAVEWRAKLTNFSTNFYFKNIACRLPQKSFNHQWKWNKEKPKTKTVGPIFSEIVMARSEIFFVRWRKTQEQH